MPPSSNRSMTMQQIFEDLDAKLSERVSEISLEIHGEMVENPPTGTPIDIGWASVNWFAKVGSAPTGNDGASGQPESRRAGQQAGITEVMSYSINGGKSIWVTNNVPYISRLNSGWSQQSPAGFVERGINKVIATYRRKKL